MTPAAAPRLGVPDERLRAVGHARPPLQVALLTGRSDPRSAALTPVQARFLESLRDRDVALVPTNFPWPVPEAIAGDRADAADDRARASPVPLPIASVRNAAQYLGSRRRTWAARHRPALESLVGRSDRTVLVCGSCGLELLANLGADRATLARIDVLAVAPVARALPRCRRVVLVRGRRDRISPLWIDAVDHLVDGGHMNVFENPAVIDLARRVVAGARRERPVPKSRPPCG